MRANEISLRLREHSGLPVTVPQLPGKAFFDHVQALSRGAEGQGIHDAVLDIVRCLQELNALRQGPMNVLHVETPSLEAAYAISGLEIKAEIKGR